MMTPAQHLKNSMNIIPKMKAVAIPSASICHTANVSPKYSENLSEKNSEKKEFLNSCITVELVIASVVGKQYLSISKLLIQNKLTHLSIIPKRCP